MNRRAFGPSLTARTPACTSLALVLLLAVGCAQPRDPGPPVWALGPADRPQVRIDPREAPALSRLRSQAAQQQTHSADAPIDAPPPPGLPPDLTQIVTDPAAAVPLDDLLPTLAASAEPTPNAEPPTPADPDEARRALAAYVAGRQKLLAGDAGSAAVEFRAATRLDPSAAEPWRELAEAQLMLGSRTEAAASFLRAFELGLEEPRILEQLGRHWLDRQDAPRAAAYFARALAADPHTSDEALPTVIHAQLAGALESMGHLAASREAIARALDIRDRSVASTRYVQDLAAVLRRHSDLWRKSGDLALRLGRHADALEAYAAASAAPALEPVDLTPRQVYAAMRAGRPAEAAVHALGGVVVAGRGVGEDQLSLLRYTAEHGGVGPAMADALGELRAALPPTLGSTIATGLARAQASLLTPARARQVLSRYAEAGHASVELLQDLFSRHESPDRVAREAHRLVQRDPFTAERTAEAILRTEHDPVAVLARLEASSDPAAQLLAAQLRAARGEADLAASLLARLRGRGDVATAAAITRAQLLAIAGIGAADDADLPPLRPNAGDAEQWVTARTLVLLERPADALAMLRPLVGPDAARTPSVDTLLLAAELANRLGDPAEAEAWLRRALELDRFDDRIHAGLIELHSPGGAAPDPSKLAQATRELRQFSPDGRVATLVRATDLLRRSQFAHAERLLRPLATDNPADLAVLDLLVAAWARQASGSDPEAIERATAWFDEQLARRPHAPALLAGLARVLVAADRAEDAASLLRRHLAAHWHARTSLALETVLRELPGGNAEADELAMRRLERLPESPARAIDRAELLARRGREAEAVEQALSIADPRSLSAEHSARLAALASHLARAAEIDADLTPPALRLLAFAADAGVRLSPELHHKRMLLLVGTNPDEDAMFDAARAAARTHPDIASTAYLLAAALLSEAGHAPPALSLLTRAAAELTAPTDEFYLEWFRLTARVGDAEHARAVIDAAAAHGTLGKLLARFNGDEQPAARDPRAEAAYTLAIFLAQFGRDDESVAMYELALEYDPAHPWACNNLGYHLLETGGDLARAEALLEAAFEALPTEASIMDSLAWLRYKQGRLRNETDPATGQIVRHGAVELLRRAATQSGQRNPTILDHFGDALWADGQRDAAVQVWAIAEQQARAQQAVLSDEPARSGWLGPLLDSIQAKLAAARAGEPPAIAPFQTADAQSAGRSDN